MIPSSSVFSVFAHPSACNRLASRTSLSSSSQVMPAASPRSSSREIVASATDSSSRCLSVCKRSFSPVSCATVFSSAVAAAVCD